jgi:hypothetical protein
VGDERLCVMQLLRGSFRREDDSGEGPNFQFSAGSKERETAGPISLVIDRNNQHMIGSR